MDDGRVSVGESVWQRQDGGVVVHMVDPPMPARLGHLTGRGKLSFHPLLFIYLLVVLSFSFIRSVSLQNGYSFFLFASLPAQIIFQSVFLLSFLVIPR